MGTDWRLAMRPMVTTERVICADQVGSPKAAPPASGQWVVFNSDWNRYT